MLQLAQDSIIPNLWGDLSHLNTYKTPAFLLKEQADFLPMLTNNIVKGEISRSEFSGDVTLYAVVPKIAKVALVEISYIKDNAPYPVKVYSLYKTETMRYSNKHEVEAHNEDEFIEALRVILTDPIVTNTISYLIADSKAIK